MSFCCSRPFLALLLGAGGWGCCSSALAGDKIEFSRASETLAMPQADHPEDDPANAFSALSFLNINSAPPQRTMPYQMMLPSSEPPSRRNGDRNSPNGHDALGSDFESSGQNGSLENPAWAAYGTNSSSKPAPNDLNEVKAWSSPDNLDSLGRGMDRMDSRYSQPNAPLGSLTPSEKRDRLNDFGLGNAGTQVGRCTGMPPPGSTPKHPSMSSSTNRASRSWTRTPACSNPFLPLPVPSLLAPGWRLQSGPCCRHWIGRRRATTRTRSRPPARRLWRPADFPAIKTNAMWAACLRPAPGVGKRPAWVPRLPKLPRLPRLPSPAKRRPPPLRHKAAGNASRSGRILRWAKDPNSVFQ